MEQFYNLSVLDNEVRNTSCNQDFPARCALKLSIYETEESWDIGAITEVPKHITNRQMWKHCIEWHPQLWNFWLSFVRFHAGESSDLHREMKTFYQQQFNIEWWD